MCVGVCFVAVAVEEQRFPVIVFFVAAMGGGCEITLCVGVCVCGGGCGGGGVVCVCLCVFVCVCECVSVYVRSHSLCMTDSGPWFGWSGPSVKNVPLCLGG